MRETSSGSFCSNDCVLQSLMVALPFGGVGKLGPHLQRHNTCKIRDLSPLACGRRQWNGLTPWPQQLRHLLSQEVMLAKKHTVRVRDIFALSTLWGPQSVPNDVGQHTVPEEPGLVPDPVTLREDKPGSRGKAKRKPSVQSCLKCQYVQMCCWFIQLK